jgi:hypothetical protein
MLVNQLYTDTWTSWATVEHDIDWACILMTDCSQSQRRYTNSHSCALSMTLNFHYTIFLILLSQLSSMYSKCSKVEWSGVKWSEGLRNRVSITIRRYPEHMKFYCFFHILLFLLFITVCMVLCFVCFYLILCVMYCYCYVYVFLLLCMFRSKYSVSLCCSVYCLCVNVYCTAATGCQPNCS